jgi:fructan beta-fructosidase
MKSRILVAIAAVLAPAVAFAQAPDPRPSYHFAPQRNWMNDPNGLVYYDGEYHLFFQYNPYGDRWGHMNWGHAVSRDLMHWTELPVAIPETDVMAFSGSAVIDWSNSSGFGKNGKPPMIALYTGANPKTGNQSQFLAYSNDRGRTFIIHGKVLDIGSPEFRDPKVFWHSASKRWVMAAVKATENKVAFYTSSNLKDWSHASDFGPLGGRGKNWECPDLFELPVEGGRPGEKRWVMSVNLGDNSVNGGSGIQYFVGDFDGRTFTPVSGWGDAPRWADWGADFYAALSWSDMPASDPRRIWIGWANNWNYAKDIPTYPSRGLMSVPRTVQLVKSDAGYRIAQAPIAELDRLRTNHRTASAIRLGEQPVALPITGDSVDLTLDIDTGTAEQLALVLTDGRGYQTLVGLTPATNEVFIDRTRSGPHFYDGFAERHIAPVDLSSRKVRLRVLVDKSIVELFVNDGTTTITERFFRGGGDLSWSMVARGGSATIKTINFWNIEQR